MRKWSVETTPIMFAEPKDCFLYQSPNLYSLTPLLILLVRL